MEEKERNDRDVQEIQQQNSESIQHSSSNNPSEIIVSKSVGPFCLRRPVGGKTNPQGKFVACGIVMVYTLLNIPYMIKDLKRNSTFVFLNRSSRVDYH